MNDHPSKMPHSQNKTRLRSLRPQLEQLDPRLCFSIDLPDLLAAFPAPDLTAEISGPVDSNAELQSELDTDAKLPHVDELINETYLNDSNDSTSTIDFDVGSWLESNEDDEKNEEDLYYGFVTSAFSGIAEAGRIDLNGALPEPSVDEVFTKDTASEVPFEVWEDTPIHSNRNAVEQSSHRQPLPSPMPTPQSATSMATNNASLPLIQPVANLSLQSRTASSDIVIRRDISSFVGSQNDTLSDDHSAATTQIADSDRKSQPDSELQRTRVGSKELTTKLTREQQTPRKTALEVENTSLPLVMEVAAIGIELASTVEHVAPDKWLASTSDIPSSQQFSPTGLVALVNAPLSHSSAADRLSGLRVIPAEQGGAPVTGVFESVRSKDTNASPEEKGTALSDNTYRLLLAGLIAIPTSTRGKKVLRWFQRDKKRDE
jgi:hypothetical protein